MDEINPTNETMTMRDLEIFKANQIDGKTLDKTAEIVGVSRKTVSRTKSKVSYHELAQAALEQKGLTVDVYAGKLIEKLDARKGVNYDGERIEEDDNVAQMTALKEVAQIYGVHAPREIDLKHSLASASDEELDQNLADAAARLGVGSQCEYSIDAATEEDSGLEIQGDVL